MFLNGYHFTIIEDQAVPLTNAPSGDNYAGYALAVIVTVAILLIGLIYCLWFRDHQKRMMRLRAELNQYEGTETQECDFTLMHPIKQLEAEKFFEQKLAGYYVTEVANI